jgi:hypothetical protein
MYGTKGGLRAVGSNAAIAIALGRVPMPQREPFGILGEKTRQIVKERPQVRTVIGRVGWDCAGWQHRPESCVSRIPPALWT